MFAWLKRKKKLKFQRIGGNGEVTETLIRAVELADQMKTVIVIYETRDSEGHPGGIIVQEDTTFAKVNWMLDTAKSWLIN